MRLAHRSQNYGISGSGLDQRLYAQEDANFDITSLIDTTGTVQMRIYYRAIACTKNMHDSDGSLHSNPTPGHKVKG